MLTPYTPILILLILSVALAGLLTLAARFLGPRRPTPAKLAPYECGIIPETPARQRFPIKFYLMAMLFIVFDIETIFLWPWAVLINTFKRAGLGGFALGEMFVFMAILALGLIYIYKKGALQWE
jgi:NADH-quinone oxidoreductase subunit A